MPNSSKIGRRSRVHLHAADQRRLEALHEAHDALVDLFVVHPDRLEDVAQLIAQDALNDFEIVMQQHRRGLLLRLLPDVEPEVVEERHVGADLFFGVAFAGRAHDEAARDALPVRLQDALQPLALFVAGDLARDADVIDRRHVDHEPARQRDVRCDARALLAERLLGNLDDDLLPFLQQVGDGRERRCFPIVSDFLLRRRATSRSAAGFARRRVSPVAVGAAIIGTLASASAAAHAPRGTMLIPVTLFANTSLQRLLGLWFFDRSFLARICSEALQPALRRSSSSSFRLDRCPSSISGSRADSQPRFLGSPSDSRSGSRLPSERDGSREERRIREGACYNFRRSRQRLRLPIRCWFGFDGRLDGSTRSIWPASNRSFFEIDFQLRSAPRSESCYSSAHPDRPAAVQLGSTSSDPVPKRRGCCTSQAIHPAGGTLPPPRLSGSSSARRLLPASAGVRR